MAKAGDDYQEIVGAIARFLDPGTSVNVGQWIEGPDGKRDMDVEVRGTLNGAPCFVLIECKDWADPVGIGVIDALDSKRRDLYADRAIIYSNSGFTAPALRKAARVGIETASALKAGDNRIKPMIQRELIAKRLSVDSMRATLYPFSQETFEIEDDWQISQLLYNDLPAFNWIGELSLRLIQEYEDARKIIFRCTFPPTSVWTYKGQRLCIAGIELVFECSKKWVSQRVQVDVTLGVYDHRHRSVVVPDQQGYILGWIDGEAWVEVDSRWDEEELPLGSFELYLTLLNPIHPIPDTAIPGIEQVILEQQIEVE